MKQILVVAPPGRLQEGLQVLLATLSDTAVAVVADARAAEAQVAHQRPQLVIVAGDDAEQAISTLVRQRPVACFLALVEHEQQRPAVEAAGADAVVVEGIPAYRLLIAVQDLLAGPSADSLEVTDDCPTTT